MKPLYKFNKKNKKNIKKKKNSLPSLPHPSSKAGTLWRPQLGLRWGGHPPHPRVHTTVHIWRTLVTKTQRWKHCGWDSQRRWGRDRKQHWLLSSVKTTKTSVLLPKYFRTWGFSFNLFPHSQSCSCLSPLLWGFTYTHTHSKKISTVSTISSSLFLFF